MCGNEPRDRVVTYRLDDHVHTTHILHTINITHRNGPIYTWKERKRQDSVVGCLPKSPGWWPRTVAREHGGCIEQNCSETTDTLMPKRRCAGYYGLILWTLIHLFLRSSVYRPSIRLSEPVHEQHPAWWDNGATETITSAAFTPG